MRVPKGLNFAFAVVIHFLLCFHNFLSLVFLWCSFWWHRAYSLAGWPEGNMGLKAFGASPLGMVLKYRLSPIFFLVVAVCGFGFWFVFLYEKLLDVNRIVTVSRTYYELKIL